MAILETTTELLVKALENNDFDYKASVSSVTHMLGNTTDRDKHASYFQALGILTALKVCAASIKSEIKTPIGIKPGVSKKSGAAIRRAAESILTHWRVWLGSNKYQLLGKCVKADLRKASEMEKIVMSGHARNISFYGALISNLTSDDQTVSEAMTNAQVEEVKQNVFNK